MISEKPSHNRDNTGNPASPENCHREDFANSNAVILKGRDWISAVVILGIILALAPYLWQQQEDFTLPADYRIPYPLGNDYWHFQRCCREAAGRYDTLLLGDSVIWGHYVKRDKTLSHYLNDIAGEQRFANLGVDGIHPVALYGLIKYYGKNISGKKILLNLNPLWLSSPRTDLQGNSDKIIAINHPRLIPQFIPHIPAYNETISNKIGIILERHLEFYSLVNHLRITAMDNMDLAHWSLERPYQNPLANMAARNILYQDDFDVPADISWKQKGITPRAFPWVELDSSWQWNFFLRTTALLQRRGNRIFVMIGPFNEYMIEARSLHKYHRMIKEIETRLRENKVNCFIADILPSEMFADASHPLAKGYARLARQLYAQGRFVQFVRTIAK